jgi:hypothetical protein
MFKIILGNYPDNLLENNNITMAVLSANTPQLGKQIPACN